jgi:hypothetical protein
MNSKEYFNRISNLELEASINRPIEEFESSDNANVLKFIKRQKFSQNAVLNKEKYFVLFAKITQATKEKIEALQSLSLESLLSILNQRDVQYQFRNLDKLDADQIRDIISDLYILDELKNEE